MFGELQVSVVLHHSRKPHCGETHARDGGEVRVLEGLGKLGGGGGGGTEISDVYLWAETQWSEFTHFCTFVLLSAWLVR